MKKNHFDLLINEEGLLPGTTEPTTLSGQLTGSMPASTPTKLAFDAMENQPIVNNESLTSSGVGLVYGLSQQNQHLSATQGLNGPEIFTLDLQQDGSYTFTLKGHIDRPKATELVKNGSLAMEDNNPPASWEIQQFEEGKATPMLVFTQDVPTETGKAYEFSLHHLPNHEHFLETSEIQIYWDDELLYVIPANNDEEKGYTFSVQSNATDENTKLQIVGAGEEGIVTNFINQISVTSAEQVKLPIEFGIITQDEHNQIMHDSFTVNIATTPPLELSNHNPVEVVYEDAVYKTIIVGDENPTSNPLTTLRIDTIFDSLSIPENERLVEVVQRLEDGNVTNVYEVKLTDVNHSLEPITVADVQLSFPGGDGGLQVFQRNVSIHEGEDSHLLPPIDTGDNIL